MVPLVRCLGAGSCPTVSLAPKDHLTRLCDSVRPASSQVRVIHLTAVKAADAHILWEESLSYWRRTWWYRSLQPIWRQGFSALHCAQESGGLRPILGLRILNGAFHKPPFKMLMQNCVFGCIRPQVWSAALTWKTRTSMCRSFRTTGHSCGWHSKDEHISTGPALRAVPVAPCLHESSGGSPCSPERTGRAHSQLPRRLAYTSSVVGPVMRTQGQGALAPQPVGPSGQLGKEQNSPRCRGSLFSVWS